MKTTTCLIIEPSDFTKDGNIKGEAFFAMANHDTVICDGKIIKHGCGSVLEEVPAPSKRRSHATRHPSVSDQQENPIIPIPPLVSPKAQSTEAD